MKRQCLSSGIHKKNIVNLLSASLAKRVTGINTLDNPPPKKSHSSHIHSRTSVARTPMARLPWMS